MDKKSIRKILIQKRLDLDKQTYLSKSSIIMRQIEQLSAFKEAKTVGIYVSMRQEVETIRFIQKWISEKRIVVPKTKGKVMNFHHIHALDVLKKGNFGVLEPDNANIVEKEEIDIMIIPIVGYTTNNHRLGYGGGYYDRYLKKYQGKKIGVAFAFQQISSMPVEEHDIPLTVIITENVRQTTVI